MALVFESSGVVKRWTYQWADICDYMDDVGNYEITGAILPTPKSARTGPTAKATFTWHHMAPMVGFRIRNIGDVIKINSIDEEDGYGRGYDYDTYHPDITFYYKNSSGSYTTIATFGTAASYRNSTTKSITITDVDTSATYVDIYVDCSATACYFHNNKEFLGRLSVNLHDHIEETNPPSVSYTGGNFIVVKNGQDGIQMQNSTEWFDTPHTFNGLENGTRYYFRRREFCEDCPDSVVVYSNYIGFRTWNISGSNTNSSTKTLTFKAKHVAGSGSVSASDRKISYRLYKSKSTSGTQVGSEIIADNNTAVTFSDLDTNTTYYCYARTYNENTGVYMSGNSIWITAKTKDFATINDNNGDVSAKTLRVSLSWNEGNSTSVVCSITCNGQIKTLENSGGYVGFTGLTPGSTYVISWSVVSTYKYTVVVDEDTGETKEFTEVNEVTGSFSLTTKKSQFISPVNMSTKIIQFASSSNYDSDVMEQRISSNNTWDIVNQDTYMIYNNLNHNTAYTIYCRIAGCYAFNDSGELTDLNDSELSQTVSTKLLSFSGSIVEEHQHSLVTLWQAKVNGVNTDSDAIDGTLFEFSYIDTIARKSNPPYQASEVIEGSDGNTTGDYQSDKKVYSNNLTWYYCEYIVTVSITDGYNIVAAAVVAHTIFPATWIYSGGQWHRYMPHVYTNGKYVPAPIFVYRNDRFIEPNGEY